MIAIQYGVSRRDAYETHITRRAGAAYACTKLQDLACASRIYGFFLPYPFLLVNIPRDIDIQSLSKT